MNESKHTEMLEIDEVDGVFVVSIKRVSIGAIGEAEEISLILRDLIREREVLRIVIDFSKVSFFSSQILGLLVDIWRRTKDKGGALLICGVNPQLMRVFRITHLDNLFDFYECTDAAISSLQKS